MKCPICVDVDLVMSDRQGVEIDYCPKCRGVWLDRGELDKIIERSMSIGLSQTSPVQNNRNSAIIDERPYHKHDNHHDHHGYRHKRKSWLGEIFD